VVDLAVTLQKKNQWLNQEPTLKKMAWQKWEVQLQKSFGFVPQALRAWLPGGTGGQPSGSAAVATDEGG
jgi:hypothetical protein